VAILRDLGIDRVRLFSNSPDKVRALSEAGRRGFRSAALRGHTEPAFVWLFADEEERLGQHLTLVRSDISEHDSGFATVEQAITELRAGSHGVVVDDEHRENEGDLTMAAEMINPRGDQFMASEGRDWCVSR